MRGSTMMIHWMLWAAAAFLVDVPVLSATTQNTPQNDNCLDARILEPNGTVATGSTVEATSKTISCEQGLARGKGTFYSVLGTGKRLRVSTCTNRTDFDAYPAVFYQPDRAVCGDAMACPVPVEDDKSCDEAYGRMFAWDSVDGQLYHVFVANPTTQGRYGVLLEEFTPPPNDVCAAAVPIDPKGQIVRIRGSTINATTESAWCRSGGFGFTQGVWYSIVGTGKPLRASICSDAVHFDGEVFVSHGDPQTCRSRNCPPLLSDRKDTSAAFCGYHKTVAWDGHLGVNYFVNVHGHVGNFELSVEEPETQTYLGNFEDSAVKAFDFLGMNVEALPENDKCNETMPLNPTGEVYVGSTVNATADEEVSPDCYEGTDPPRGVWFEVSTPIDTILTVSTCHSETTESVNIAVFPSISCSEEMECLDLDPDDTECASVPAGVTAWTYTFTARGILAGSGPSLIYVYASSSANFGISVRDARATTFAPVDAPPSPVSPVTSPVTFPVPSIMPSLRTDTPSARTPNPVNESPVVTREPTPGPLSGTPTIGPTTPLPMSLRPVSESPTVSPTTEEPTPIPASSAPSATPASFPPSKVPALVPSSDPTIAPVSIMPTLLPTSDPTTPGPTSAVPTPLPTAIPTQIPQTERPVPSTDNKNPPVSFLSKAPSQMIDPFSLCKDAMVNSDREEDKFLNQNEYTIFVNQMSNNDYASKSLEEMPKSIRSNYFALRGENGKINIAGARMNDDAADEQQQQFLKVICSQTRDAIGNVEATSDPDAIPSQLPSSDASASPSRVPTSAPTVVSRVPSGAPTLVPSDFPTISLSPTFTPQPSPIPTISLAPTRTVSPTRSSLPSYVPTTTRRPSTSTMPSFSPTLSHRPSAASSQSPSKFASTSPSMFPTQSFLPTSTPSVSQRPSTSAMPSSRPSVSSAPTTSASPTVSSPPSLIPTSSQMPSASAEPSLTPSASAAPTQSASDQQSFSTLAGNYTGNITVETSFIIANLRNISAESIDSGPEREALEKAYVKTVQEVIDALVAGDGASQLYKLDTTTGTKGDGSRRLGTASLEQGSHTIEVIEDTACPPDQNSTALCQLVKASFRLIGEDVNRFGVKREVEARMNTAIKDGVLSESLNQQGIPSISVVGVASPSPTPAPTAQSTPAPTSGPDQIKSGDGLSSGAIAGIAIVALVIACGAAVGGYYWWRRRQNDPTQPLNSPSNGMSNDDWRDEGPFIEDPNIPMASPTSPGQSGGWVEERAFLVEEPSQATESRWDEDSAFDSTSSEES